jgi:NAD+ diphosphatase
MKPSAFRFCPQCTTPLAWQQREEDGGLKDRLACSGCGFVHWNNPTPVLAAVIEYQGQLLLARNAAWSGRMFALITGFMEAGESPQEGITREVKEETNLTVDALELIGVYDFQRMNQLIVAFAVQASGTVALSPELAEYKLYHPADVKCWRAGTGYALADWLKARGHTPQFVDLPAPRAQQAADS